MASLLSVYFTITPATADFILLLEIAFLGYCFYRATRALLPKGNAA